jgi:hypothetical protein
MYFSIFPDSEYYFDEDKERETDREKDCDIYKCVDEEDICLICWNPGNKQNEINILTEFSHIKSKCKCKPKLHTLCINEWIKKSPTCPICRTKLNIIIFTTDGKNIFLNCYIKCLSYTVGLLRFLCYVSFLNIFFLIFYNTIYIYYMSNNYYDDNYNIY